REHDATAATADDQRLVLERGIVAHFHGSVEGVAIQMGDGEQGEFGMKENARTAASRTSSLTFRRVLEAIAAKPRQRRTLDSKLLSDYRGAIDLSPLTHASARHAQRRLHRPRGDVTPPLPRHIACACEPFVIGASGWRLEQRLARVPFRRRI